MYIQLVWTLPRAIVRAFTVCYSIQWNLQTRDTLGLIVFPLVEKLSLSKVLNKVVCKEVVPISEGPLSEVPLYMRNHSGGINNAQAQSKHDVISIAGV